MVNDIISANTVLSAKHGACYIRIKEDNITKTYNFAQVTKLEAKIEREKSEFSALGRTGKLHKNVGWKGTGSATFRFNTNKISKVFEKFQEGGEDLVFDIVIENSDPQTSSYTGKQRTTLINCCIDGGTLAKIDIDSEILDQDVTFTFDAFKVGTGTDGFTSLPQQGGFPTF